MRVVVAGATGLVGRALVASLVNDGIEVVALTRRPRVARALLPSAARVVHWTGKDPGDWVGQLRGSDAVVNLGGASIGSRPWTAGRRREILSSRVESTDALVEAIGSLPAADRPRVLVNSSGMDHYGDRPAAEAITETSGPGSSFLAGVCQAWESSALRAGGLGVRVAIVRTGLVIDRSAPAFRLLALPSRLGLAGRLGTGDQRFTWIHLRDLIGLIRLAIANPAISGPLNAIAPDAPPQREVALAMARALHRPAALHVPARLMRLAMGDLADLMLHGRAATPMVALAHGYVFLYPTLADALTEAFGPRQRPSARDLHSPFERAVAPGERPLLSAELERQLFRASGVTVLSGSMSRIWRRHRWLAPAFHALVPLRILFADTGRNIPMTLTIRHERDGSDQPIQRWERAFRFPKHTRRFDADLVYDPDLGQVVERTGPGGVFETAWRLSVLQSGLVIEVDGIRIRVGGLRVGVPRWCGVEGRVEERVDPSVPGRIELAMSLTNPLLGPVFGYEGTVTVSRS